MERKRPNPALRRLAFLGNLGGILFPLGAIALLSVPGILAYQLSRYVDTGVWPEITLADGLDWAGIALPGFSWRGLQLASEQFLRFPLSLVLLAVLVGLMSLYAEFSQWLEKRCEPGLGDPPGRAD